MEPRSKSPAPSGPSLASPKSPAPSFLPLLYTVAGISLIKSMTIPALMGVFRMMDPHYASPNCLLNLVNMTAPDHYARHPFWKDLTYNDECSGEDYTMKDFVFAQFDGPTPEFEYWIFVNTNRIFFCMAVLALANFVWCDGVVNLVKMVRTNLLSCFFTMALLFMFAHFENDNTL